MLDGLSYSHTTKLYRPLELRRIPKLLNPPWLVETPY